MIAIPKEKVVAIVPAFNEEKNVVEVLKSLLDCQYFSQVMLVDDGSTDNTANIARGLKVNVVRLKKNGGKARAIKAGVELTDADIIAFFDADLLGLTKSHIYSLIGPLLNNQAVMCAGIRGHWWGLPKLLAKISPVMLAIGGERAIRPYVLKNIPQKFLYNLTAEVVMNYYCKVNKLPVAFVDLKGLDIVTKEKKWGLVKGLMARLCMIGEFVKIMVVISFYKKDFIEK